MKDDKYTETGNGITGNGKLETGKIKGELTFIFNNFIDFITKNAYFVE